MNNTVDDILARLSKAIQIADNAGMTDLADLLDDIQEDVEHLK